MPLHPTQQQQQHLLHLLLLLPLLPWWVLREVSLLLQQVLFWLQLLLPCLAAAAWLLQAAAPAAEAPHFDLALPAAAAAWCLGCCLQHWPLALQLHEAGGHLQACILLCLLLLHLHLC
jgi:hypothetical protein